MASMSAATRRGAAPAPVWRGALVAAACAGLAACSGSGVGLDASGRPLQGAGAPPPLAADFDSIQQNIFTPICTRCHSGASAPEGLQLDAAHSYALLIGVPSNERADLLRVHPGDPDHSYLVLKLEGASGIVGAQMPFGGPYLQAPQIDAIRQWIIQGALAGAAGAAPTPAARSLARPAVPFTLSASTPADGETRHTPVRSLALVFNRALDASLLESTIIRLERVEGSAGLAHGIPVSVAPAVGNPATLILRPAVPLGPGLYRLQLSADSGALLADLDGDALAGELALSFTVEVAP